MNFDFKGKTAVVTGSARGIGFACAELLAKSGARVALVDVLADPLADSAKKLQQYTEAGGYALDISKVSTIAPVIEKIRKELGEIDVLVQAAGLMRGKPAEDLTENEWDEVQNVNAKGLFFMMQAVAKQSMIPRKTGAIVNFSSIAGLRGMKEPMNSVHYCASKAAVVMMTKQTAVEWGKFNIRVNAVAPGGVMSGGHADMPPEFMKEATALIPLKKLSKTTDIANGVCFLASEAAGMVTGHVMVIDGGGFAVGF